jgi:hypothetical protein
MARCGDPVCVLNSSQMARSISPLLKMRPVPFLMSRRIRSSCRHCKRFPPPSEGDLWSWTTRGYRCDGVITRTSIVTLPTRRACPGRCGTCLLATGGGGDRGARVRSRFGRHRQACSAQRPQHHQPALHRAVGGDLAAGCPGAGRAPAEAERKMKTRFRTEFRTDFGQRSRCPSNTTVS